MKYRHSFPRVVDFIQLNGFIYGAGLKGHAGYFVTEFHRLVIPLLERFCILDDERLNKYLTCKTFKDIYDDIISIPVNNVIIKNLESVNENFWLPYRAERCTAKRPTDKDFEFGLMPYAYVTNANAFIQAISVKDKQLLIDKKMLEELCVVRPTDQQRAVYDLAAQFCEDLKKLGCDEYAKNLFKINDKGESVPDLKSIIWGFNDPFRH